MEYKIPEKARLTLMGAYQQRESVVAQFDAALKLAFDSMGVQGAVINVDLVKGVVTTKAPDPGETVEDTKPEEDKSED